MARDGYHAWRMLFEEHKTVVLRPDPLWNEQVKKWDNGILKAFCSPMEKSAVLLSPGAVPGQTQRQHT